MPRLTSVRSEKIRLDKRQNCDIIISLLSKCGSSSVVEHNLAKVGVAGSSPVVRSIAFPDRLDGPFSAKWPSGKAEACKAFTPGSNPGFASRQHPGAPVPVLFYICGHGSVGRAQPCQGWGRGFEPRCPLQTQQPDYHGSRAFSYPSQGLEPERERA